LHTYETHERDKDDKMQITKHSAQRDNEILEAVWRKWALDSGFKSLNKYRCLKVNLNLYVKMKHDKGTRENHLEEQNIL
jgi:hypothetical protein